MRFQRAKQPHEATLLQLDASKATQLLQWKPVLTLEESIEWVVEWYHGNAAGDDVLELSLRQLSRYQARSDSNTLEKDLMHGEHAA